MKHMDYRKVALRVLYSSLGIAALSGILAMILPNAGEVIGRLIGTAIATAIGSAMLLISIQRFEVRTTRKFGAALGILVLIIYLSTLIAIWVNFVTPLRGLNLEEKFALTALLIAGCGSLSVLGVLLIEMKRLKLAGYVLSILWLLPLLGWLLIIWIFTQPSQTSVAENILFPIQTLFPLLVLACVKRHIAFMSIAITTALVCCVTSQVAMFLTTGHLEQNLPLLMVILISGGISAMFGIANVIQFRKPKNSILWFEWLTLFIVSIAVSVLCVSIWYDTQDIKLPEMVLRVAVGTGILSSTAIIALLIGQMVRGSMSANFDGDGIGGICPRCQSAIHVPCGKSSCPTCGLRMKLAVESPCCRACGYDITKSLSDDACSECGEPIANSTGVQ